MSEHESKHWTHELSDQLTAAGVACEIHTAASAPASPEELHYVSMPLDHNVALEVEWNDTDKCYYLMIYAWDRTGGLTRDTHVASVHEYRYLFALIRSLYWKLLTDGLRRHLTNDLGVDRSTVDALADTELQDHLNKVVSETSDPE